VQDELLDLVNDNDEVIGTMWRSQVYREGKLSMLRATWLLIRDDAGKFWIPRRHPAKKILPNALDGSAVGHVGAGESYEQAMIRETLEELNIDVSHLPYHYVGKITPADGTLCHMAVFELQVPVGFNIDYNKADICESFWLTAQEIVDRIRAGEVSKDALPRIMKKFYHAI
jgi:isopentenyldiphosphate isomerase